MRGLAASFFPLLLRGGMNYQDEVTLGLTGGCCSEAHAYGVVHTHSNTESSRYTDNMHVSVRHDPFILLMN